MSAENVDLHPHAAEQLTIPAALSSPSPFSSENIKHFHLAIQFVKDGISLVMGQAGDILCILAMCFSFLY